jgi:hypothetical protein
MDMPSSWTGPVQSTVLTNMTESTIHSSFNHQSMWFACYTTFFVLTHVYLSIFMFRVQRSADHSVQTPMFLGLTVGIRNLRSPNSFFSYRANCHSSTDQGLDSDVEGQDMQRYITNGSTDWSKYRKRSNPQIDLCRQYALIGHACQWTMLPTIKEIYTCTSNQPYRNTNPRMTPANLSFKDEINVRICQAHRNQGD